MSYIADYSVYLPQFTIADNILHPKGKENKHAISYVDEDIISLAFEASSKLNTNVDAVLFATSTPIFKDRYHASFLADLLNIPEGIAAFDFSTTNRCGTDALLLADAWVRSGKYENILIVAADVRFPAIGKEVNTAFGHGAVAMIISKKEGLVEIVKTDSYSASLGEEFQYKGSEIHYDNRFAITSGFKNNLKLALKNLDAISIDSLILNSPYSRLSNGILKKAGFDLEKHLTPDTMLKKYGDIGSANGLLRIVEAIQNNNKSTVLIDYANGSNVVSIKDVKSSKSPSVVKSKNKTNIKNYQDFLTIRKQGNFESTNYEKIDLFSSEMMQEREKDHFVYLKGFECESCGNVYFLKAARCNNCQGTKLTEKKLSKKGKVFSLTAEHYFPSSFPPINMMIIDLEGGGRLTLQQTDDMYQNEDTELKIGDEVRLVLRKMMENDSKPNYFWKCVRIING